MGADLTQKDIKAAREILKRGNDVELRRRGEKILVLEVEKRIRN